MDAEPVVEAALAVLETLTACPSCRETQQLTPLSCVRCGNVYCLRCTAGSTEPPAPFIICDACRLQPVFNRHLPLTDPAEEPQRRRVVAGLLRAYAAVITHVKRAATKSSYRRSMEAIKKFGENLQLRVLPADRDVVIAFAMYMLCWRQLDSSSINNTLVALGDWHDYTRQVFQRAYPNVIVKFHNPINNEEIRELVDTLASNYKKKSQARVAVSIAQAKLMFDKGFKADVRGLHHRLAVQLCLLGMLRQKAATMLIVVYRLVPDPFTGRLEVVFLEGSDIFITSSPDCGEYIVINVDIDKNVNALKRRQAFIPDEVPALGIRPVAELRHYLRTARPPSGGYLLSAPLGTKAKTFRSNRFTAMADVFKKAFAAVFPTDPLVKLIGSHSGRKSLSQWLWDDGHCRRIIADAGGWFLKRDAVDLYFKTAPRIIISAVRNIGSSLLRR